MKKKGLFHRIDVCLLPFCLLLAYSPMLAMAAEGETTDAAPIAASHGNGGELTAVLELKSETERTAALYALLAKTDTTGLARYAEEAAAIEDQATRLQILGAVYTRFAELDVKAAVRNVVGSKLDLRLNFVLGLFNYWARQDLETSIKEMSSLQGMTRYAAMQGIALAVPDLKIEDPDAVLDRLNKLAPPPPEVKARQQAQKPPDPETLWKDAVAEKDPQLRRGKIDRVVHIWASSEPMTAIEHVDRLPSLSERRNFRYQVFDVASRTFPELMPDLLALTSDSNERHTILEGALRTIVVVQKDGERGLELVRQLPTSELRRQGYNSLLGWWGSVEPRAAARAYGEMEDREKLQNMGAAAVSGYVKLDAKEALQWAEDLDGVGGLTWNMAVRAMAREKPEWALQVVSDLPESAERTKTLKAVLDSVADSNPPLAAQYSSALPEGPLRNRIATRALGNWARWGDHLAAMEWLTTQPLSVQAGGYPTLAAYLADKDMEFVLSYPVKLIPENARAGWVSAVLRKYMQDDPHAAAVWLDQFKDQSQYSQWLEQVASVMARKDPYGALDLINGLTDRDKRLSAESSVINSWAQTQGQAAAGWVMTQPAGESRRKMVRSVAVSWGHEQPEAARQWVLGLTDPDERENAIVGLINGLWPEYIGAEDLLLMLKTDDRKSDALGIVLPVMVHRDPDAARALVDRMGMTGRVHDAMNEFIDHLLEQNQWQQQH